MPREDHPTKVLKSELIAEVTPMLKKSLEDAKKINQAVVEHVRSFQARITALLQGVSQEITLEDEEMQVTHEVEKITEDVRDGILNTRIPADKQTHTEHLVDNLDDVRSSIYGFFSNPRLKPRPRLLEITGLELTTGEAVYLDQAFSEKDIGGLPSILSTLEMVAEKLNRDFHNGEKVRTADMVWDAYKQYRLDPWIELARRSYASKFEGGAFEKEVGRFKAILEKKWTELRSTKDVVKYRDIVDHLKRIEVPNA